MADTDTKLAADLTFAGTVESIEVELPDLDDAPRPVVACEITLA